MKDILIINTGGTFNKVYDEIKGQLIVPNSNKAVEEIISKSFRGNINYDLKGVVYKDSLEINDSDREDILSAIGEYEKVVIIHGTDTMDITAKFLDEKINNKKIILTGAMHPFSINNVEATSNFTIAVNYLTNVQTTGVYISMHGLVKPYTNLIKNRELGIFQCQK